MTRHEETVLATRHLRVADSDVQVTIGVPRRHDSIANNHYCCLVKIEGLHTDPIRLQTISPSVEQTLTLALSAVTQRLDIEIDYFLAEAQLGSPDRTTIG
ncbi:hypothetical protein GZH49_00520 [Nocardia terpenica]|uniref:hypothetical protein n=1 Tax=Nocardia terpenica TaxID=455432 RepID=UPI002FE25B27